MRPLRTGLPAPNVSASSLAVSRLVASPSPPPQPAAASAATVRQARTRRVAACMECGAATASIGRVRRPPVALLATLLAVLLVPAAAHAQAPRTVPAELDALLAAGASISSTTTRGSQSYDNAKANARSSLHGALPARELDARDLEHVARSPRAGC